MNPTHSRERFYEAHDLILRAWTEPGPFPFMGKHYRYRYVNPWPRPLQKPHPPVLLPGTGSLETVEFAAGRRYPFMMVYSPVEQQRRAYALYHRLKLTLYTDRLRAGIMVSGANWGDMPPDKVAKNREIFATQVMPEFRER